MINCNGKKHRNKSYANGSNGNFAVLNMPIFLTQANMSLEYDNFSYSGKYEPRKSLGRLAFVAGGISWPVNSHFYLNDHKSTDLYLKMLTTFAYLYICLCGSCAVGVLVAVGNYHLGIVKTSPPPPPLFTWDLATLQSLKNENIFCIMMTSIKNDNIYSKW